MTTTKKTAAAFALAAGALVTASACSAPAAKPAPAVTKTVPAPAVTKVKTQAPPAPEIVTKTLSGTGSYTSAPVQFGCKEDGNPITVAYSYSHNTSGYGGDNFEAELDDSTGTEVGNEIANDIAVSGSKTTHVYPDSFDTPPFHLTVTATGSWKFTFTCDAK